MNEKTYLYQEHARLVSRKFFHPEGFSEEEEQRLQKVKDRLDEIEMEESGHGVLDKLKQKTESCEKINQQAKDLMEMVEEEDDEDDEDDEVLE